MEWKSPSLPVVHTMLWFSGREEIPKEEGQRLAGWLYQNQISKTDQTYLDQLQTTGPGREMILVRLVKYVLTVAYSSSITCLPHSCNHLQVLFPTPVQLLKSMVIVDWRRNHCLSIMNDQYFNIFNSLRVDWFINHQLLSLRHSPSLSELYKGCYWISNEKAPSRPAHKNGNGDGRLASSLVHQPSKYYCESKAMCLERILTLLIVATFKVF